ncbi:hypothetical protein MPDQ_002980 [Monascus purpureus]|uniref:Uncharacterized protein n=1 Tax=Monascus purpureus TaxID=5098 RepID=A0A507R6F3_MONPU|nr:hypothetical protein MPDQ_002980 [Monascus purpureus]BDD59458.1 hypothetical protein MAP00_004665 [Monascus purpureus]
MTTHPSLFQSPFLISFYLLCVIFTVTVNAESDPVHNSVDRSLLAAQIGAIVGGYVFFVSVLLALLLSVGRCLRRRRINSSDYTSMMKLSKSAGGLDSTVSSPETPRSLIWSWSSFKGSKSRISNVSEVTVDDSVVAADRKRAQEQMAELYAAVMEHDTKRAAGIGDSVDGFKYPSSQPSNPFDTPVSQRGGPFSMHNQKQGMSSPLSLFSPTSRSSVESDGIRPPPQLSAQELSISPPLPSSKYNEEPIPLTLRGCDTPRALPAAPQVQASHGKTKRGPVPAPLNVYTGNNGSTTSTLPFRQVYPPPSAPATKTTILERPTLVAGPRTGIPVPYSPYIPFTPVTPITPSRIVTKKQRKKEDKGVRLKVLNEDDLVKEDSEMWEY